MKKVFGILFILVSLLLALSLFVQLPTTINYFKVPIKDFSNGSKMGALTGHLIATALTSTLTIFLFVKGINGLDFLLLNPNKTSYLIILPFSNLAVGATKVNLP